MTADRLLLHCVLLAVLFAIMMMLTGCQPNVAPAPGPAPGSTPGSRSGHAVNTLPGAHAHDRLRGEDRLAAKRGPRADSVRSEPQMRIRIGRSLQTTAVAGSGTVRVGPGAADVGRARDHTFQAPLRISHDRQGFVLTQPDGERVRWRLSTLSVTADAGRFTINGDGYPGRLELVARNDKAGRPAGTFDAVNHVGMESYLPGVISKELYPGWDYKAYRAQAIAARSYAIWEMNLPMRRASHFDLEASQASQAYIGDSASEKARKAVADTAGQVLVYDYRVLPAFYSSTSGGTGQDAAAAWPGKVDDLAPLRGRSHGGWGQQSPKFRWTVQRDRSALSKRIAAWGRANKDPVAAFGTIARVDVTNQNTAGRPTTVRVTDTNGRSFNLTCEDLRMASNYKHAALPTVTTSTLVYSGHTTYAVSGNTVTITGRGFGHGVGMCQFGAQHMATEDHEHRAILGFYYPGARVKKVY